MDTATLLWALGIFIARVVSVSLGTLRILLNVRGHKFLAAFIGFFEVLIFVLVIGRVVQDIGNVWNVLAYAGGFSIGSLVGALIEEKMALGYGIVRIVSRDKGHLIAQALRDAGYGVTDIHGEGLSGPVSILNVVTRRRDVPAVVELANRLDDQAFITVEGASRVYRGYLRHAQET